MTVLAACYAAVVGGGLLAANIAAIRESRKTREAHARESRDATRR